MRTKKIYITGMHCISCEQLLTAEFKELPDIVDAKVSQATNTAILSYEHTLDLERVRKTAAKYGYTVSESPFATKSSSISFASFDQWLFSLLIALALLALFMMFQRTGWIEQIQIAEGNVTWGMAFLVGVAASLSSCLVVVGAVVMAFGQRYQVNGSGNFQQIIKPNLLFHTGRLFTFAALGGLLGLVGGELLISGHTIFIITTFVALLLLWLGLNSLGLLPSLSRLKITLPAKMSAGRWARLKNSDHPYAPLLLGGLSFFLPCGFTQTMQIMALTSGSFQTGTLIMLSFALGTTPVLFLLGTSTSWIKKRQSTVLQRAIGMILVIFSLYTLNSAWTLKGVQSDVINSQTSKNTQTENEKNEPKQQNNSQEQIVKMTVNSRGFEPRTIPIKKDIPVKWIINGEYVTGCTNNIIIPGLNISQDIKKGLNVVEFTPTQEGKLAFSCWMGMVRGEFIVH